MRRVELVLLLAGIVGLAAIIREVGADEVFTSLRDVAWLLPLLMVGPEAVTQGIEALAWRFAFARDLVPTRELLLVRIAGEALNMTTPTASLGGEGVKAWLLRDRVRLRDVVPSLLVAKSSDALSQVLLLALGIACAWHLPRLDPRMFSGMLTLLVVECLAVAGFLFVQTSGAVARGGVVFNRLGLIRKPSTGSATLHVDRRLARYYRRRRGRFALSTLLNLLSFLVGALETGLLTWALSGPPSWADMLVVSAIASALTFVGFFVPGQIAIREGAYVAAFVALGLEPATGLAVGLAKRVLDLAWAALGFVALSHYRRTAPVS
jgi:uncharacterized membrane protein YbhN (UPF0104 family)